MTDPLLQQALNVLTIGRTGHEQEDWDACVAALRARVAQKDAEPVPELTLYYMRDNHTFCPLLPLDVGEAIETIRAEFHAGHAYGMLCSRHPKVRGVVHAHGLDKWDEFELQARTWLGAALAAKEEP